LATPSAIGTRWKYTAPVESLFQHMTRATMLVKRRARARER